MNQKEQTKPIKSKQYQKKKQLKKNKPGQIFTKNWFWLLVFLLVTLLAYSNSFGVPFQFDDHNQISYRQWYHTFDFFKNFKNWINVNDRPLSFFTITINYILYGEKVFGYHLVNFLIHLATGTLLFFWLKSIPAIKNDETKSHWFPVVVTLFFLVNPVQTQSVTYIIQRMSSLAGMFFMLSVFLYTRGRLKQFETDELIKSGGYYLLSVLAGVFAVLSKQNAVVFPVMFLLVELFFIRNNEGKICRKYIITTTVAGVVLLAAILLVIGLPAETKEVTRVQYLATQMFVIPRYFQLMLFPVGLSIDHGVKMAHGFLNIKSLLGMLFLLAIVIYAFLMIRKEPLFSFGIFWIFISLLVESSILPITDPMFDQRMYLPLVGFGIALWALVDRYVLRRKRKLLKPVAIVVLLTLSVMTFARNGVWNSRVAIWEDVTDKYPGYLRGWMALGKMYREEPDKDIAKSIRCFEEARNIAPDNEENLVDLGFTYLEAGQEDKALACYGQLLDAKNKVYKIQALKVISAYNSGKGNFAEAEKYIRAVIAIDKTDQDAWGKLCSVFFDKKDYRRAQEIALEWLSDFPQNSNANFWTGKTYFFLNERDMARDYLLKAIQLDQENTEAMMLYANVCVNRFEYDEAIKYLEKAYAINKNSSIPRNIEMIKQFKIKNPKPQ